MNKIIQTVLAGAAILASGQRTNAATTVFQDPITNYTVSADYESQTAAVTKPQDNGGFIGVFTNLGSWTGPPGDQFVSMSSGGYGAYTTLAAPAPVTDRYGRIFVRVGKNPTTTSWMRLILSTNSAPMLPVQDTGTEAGPDVIWAPGGGFRYFNGGTEVISGSYPSSEFHNLTVNYDLLTATYEIWVNTSLLASGLSFESAGFGSTARSIALGGAYWGSDGIGAVLDQWYWQSDNLTPFTSYGHAIPEPSAAALALVALGLLRRRR